MTPATTASTTAASSSVETAMIAGERLNCTSVKSLTGNVIAPGPEMKSAITTSSNETTKTSKAPESSAGRIAGRYTQRSTDQVPAPRLIAERTSAISSLLNAARTVRNTKGTPSTAWAIA